MSICKDCVNDDCQMHSGIERQNCEFYRELKPCPFCGGQAIIVTSDKDSAFVACKNVFKCGARQEWFDSEKEAIEAWNRRVDDESKHK